MGERGEREAEGEKQRAYYSTRSMLFTQEYHFKWHAKLKLKFVAALTKPLDLRIYEMIMAPCGGGEEVLWWKQTEGGGGREGGTSARSLTPSLVQCESVSYDDSSCRLFGLSRDPSPSCFIMEKEMRPSLAWRSYALRRFEDRLHHQSEEFGQRQAGGQLAPAETASKIHSLITPI